MLGSRDYARLIISAMADGKPKSAQDIVNATSLERSKVWTALSKLWRAGLVLRTDRPVSENCKKFRGRHGATSNTRLYHLYVLNGDSTEPQDYSIDGRRFVRFSSEYSDKRGSKGEKSKARLILNFLKDNSDRAFYSTEIYNALKDRGVKMPDVMTAARRYERKGLLYIRGYQTHDSCSPFAEGYLVTWIDSSNKDETSALKDAVAKTNQALSNKASTNPVVERVLAIRNTTIAESELGRLVSFNLIRDKLGTTENEANTAVARAMQLYPGIKEVKLFGNFRYYYHESSMNGEVLNAALEMAKNYIRMSKGRANRIGHNWEACVEWFIDKFTVGAEFRMQNHRNNGNDGRMDPRRITLHLIKSVGDRRQNAEVDRVWTVTPSVFAKPITYVLECKWGIVRRKDLDDFFNVLKWSTDFGVDTPEGRQVKNGVIGVFAAGAFEDIHIKVNGKDGTEGEKITLAQYASRLNVQLLRASDFNQKLHDRQVPKEVTVQKICRAARNENDVRRMLDAIWDKPENAVKVLSDAITANSDVYRFEEELEEGKGKEKREVLPTELPSTAAAEV
ncbi:hypothetical protein Ngar_c24170 [Candidatus Nitrososphaera gargensis Ga9.2]|uniref:Uncharacterized protein n=1 Tax=Nitrososphaera gargensis (strain Ga9.2) TaxID=1237085 RepID=K0ID75_NITGG|nr:hypothetical protein [Candidatus Nitrososphaera gargensis]AFU59341.1 hypothetical protein Ngar_c24170 [Candidatus Nitrososphaera gargensis Ga9.2]